MAKYYKVFLIDDSKNTLEDYSTIEENYAICKEAPVGFKELVTEKDVYPRAAGTPIPALTFGNIPTTLYLSHDKRSKSKNESYGKSKMIEMTAKDVLIWWSSMNETTLKEYVDNINRLEEFAISKYYRVQQVTNIKDEKHKSKKCFKRTIKQTKKR